MCTDLPELLWKESIDFDWFQSVGHFKQPQSELQINLMEKKVHSAARRQVESGGGGGVSSAHGVKVAFWVKRTNVCRQGAAWPSRSRWFTHPVWPWTAPSSGCDATVRSSIFQSRLSPHPTSRRVSLAIGWSAMATKLRALMNRIHSNQQTLRAR